MWVVPYFILSTRHKEPTALTAVKILLISLVSFIFCRLGSDTDPF